MNTTRPVRRRAIVAAALVALYTVTGFFVLPPIVKSQAEKRLSAMLGRQVTVERVRLNPYTLSVTLENFAIKEQDGQTLFLGWRSLYVNFDALSSLFGEWVLSDVRLDGFTVRGVVNSDQSLNVSDLLAKFAPAANAPGAPAGKPSRPLRIGHLAVVDARVDVMDRSRKQPFATTVGPLSFDLTNFRTVGERGAPYRFEAVTEAGEKFAWSGTLRAEPFQSAGELSIENVVLGKYAPYYADRIGADIVSGKLSLRGKYEIDLTESHRVMNLRDGALRLRELALRERGRNENTVDLPELEIAGVQADALAPKAIVGSVAVNGGQVRVRREKDGTLNLLAMLQAPGGVPVPANAAPAPAASSGSAASASATKLPDVTVTDVTIKNFAVQVTDLTAPRPADFGFSGLDLSLCNVTLAEGAKMPIKLTLNWAPKGAVSVDGQISIFPIGFEGKVDVKDFALMPASPYAEALANAHLTQGSVTASFATHVALSPGKPLDANLSGDVRVEKVGVVDGVKNEEFAGFGSLALRGIRVATMPQLSVAVDEVAVAAPYAHVSVAPDNTLNVLTVATPVSVPAVASVQPPAAAPVGASTVDARPNIEIGKIVISDGEFRFQDRSLTPGVSVAVRQFSGTIGGLSSTNPAKGDVDLKANVDGTGTVAIRGRLDPLGAKPSIDLKLDVKNVDLVPLSPYSGKYAGYELARGKLVVDMKASLDGKKLDSNNVVTLNQFTFGAPVESPDATKLPVRLGVALLKDIDGKIVIDIPVQGSTDDPNFRIGRVVLRVVVNLLTKAAVSPFSLLGAAFGGGGDELAYQEFAPGSSDLQPAEVKKLETLAKALTNRPGLSLDLDGSYDVAADAYALKRLKLADKVRRAIWEQKRQGNPNIPPPEELTITPEENAAMIKKLFDLSFPPGTQFGAPVPPAPAVVKPPQSPSAGWLKRIWLTVTFANQRAARTAAAENTRLTVEHEKAVAAATATGLPLDEMTGRLAEATTVDATDLQGLAEARARRVQAYLAETGKISIDRLFLAKPTSELANRSRGPRVFLTLQ